MPGSRSIFVLAVSTWAFVVCFAVWLMFGVIGIPISFTVSIKFAAGFFVGNTDIGTAVAPRRAPTSCGCTR